MKYAVLPLFLLVTGAHAATTFTWTVDNQLYYLVRTAKEFKAEIESKTNGNVRINVVTYDAESRKNKTDFDDIQEGRTHISQTVVGDFSQKVPEFKIWNMPYLFRDDNHLEKFLTGPVAKSMAAKLETDKVLPVEYTFSGGLLHTFCDKKLSSFSDVTGKLHMAIDSGFAEDFLTPRKIPWAREMDNYKAKCSEVLGSDVVDFVGREDSKDLYFHVTNHRVVARVLFVSKDQLAKLSRKDQKMFIDTLQDFAVQERQYSYIAKDLSLAVVKNRGFNLITWDEKTIAKEKEKFSVQYNEYKKQFPKEVNYIEGLYKPVKGVASR